MGGIKILQKDLIKLINNKDGTFINEKIVSSRRIITIQCNKDNNIWETPLFRLKKGAWCKVCFDRENKVDRKAILQLVAFKNYELLTVGELTRISRIKIRCIKHGFEWETCYGSLKYTTGKHNCRLCATGFPSLKVINNFITSKNGILIKRLYDKNTDGRNLVVKCIKHDHVWKTRWDNLQKKIWCSKCAHENRTIKHEEIEALIESKNAILLTKNCFSATQKVKVKCLKDDYEWTTTWARINQNYWCPRCSGIEKYTTERVREILKEKGGELLDGYINNVKQKISVKCNCGNVFSSALSHIVNHNLWCQLCDLSNSTQKRLYKIVKEFFPKSEIKFNYRGFGWLKTKKSSSRNMEIDIWIPEIKLAIEYDGEQHFKPVKFAKTMTDEQAEKAFQTTKRHDRKKTKLIIQHPDQVRHFIRFNYKDEITRENVISVLKSNGVLV